MPELPEVECVRRTLAPHVMGRRLAGVEVSLAKVARPSPQALSQGVAGRLVTGHRRHGKLLSLELEGGALLAVHLRMTGQLVPAAARPEAKHIHAQVRFADDGPSIWFRDVRQFGWLGYFADQAELAAGPLAGIGPDALGLPPADLARLLAPKAGRIKAALLDQRVVAGVGNIYADECLHRAGIHPEARPRDLSQAQLERLGRELNLTLAEAIARGGSSVSNFVDADGRPGTFQETHRAYKRTGQPCPACGEGICRIVVAGRSTHFCPACQKP